MSPLVLGLLLWMALDLGVLIGFCLCAALRSRVNELEREGRDSWLSLRR